MEVVATVDGIWDQVDKLADMFFPNTRRFSSNSIGAGRGTGILPS